MMTINDSVYGAFDIEEPVLSELIATSAVQRLRHITMGGIVALLDISPQSTRFEHSVGAMILVRKLGGTIEEQVAALLHDISHTAFSHVIDYALDSPSSQNYHEKVKTKYVMETEIPSICRKHNLDLEYILDEERHSILEQNLPRLCVDRIDYTLRDISYLRNNCKGELSKAVQDLVVDGGFPAFKTLESALLFSNWYLECSSAFWMNIQHCSLYHACGEAIRIALREGLISESDFWLSDQEFWVKLNQSTRLSPEVKCALDLVSSNTKFEITKRENADFIVHRKIRWIDPDVKYGGLKQKLSEISSEYLEKIQALKSEYKNQVPVKVVGGAEP